MCSRHCFGSGSLLHSTSSIHGLVPPVSPPGYFFAQITALGIKRVRALLSCGINQPGPVTIDHLVVENDGFRNGEHIYMVFCRSLIDVGFIEEGVFGAQ